VTQTVAGKVLPLIDIVDCPPVLITGGAGYIGSHAALALLDLGVRVVIVDDMSTGSSLLLPPDAVFVQGRAGDGALIRQVIADHGIGAVMHFAASISVAESVAEPAFYYRNNFAETLVLAEAAVAGGVATLVFSSTAAVYAENDGQPLRESDALGPINPYGASKAMAEIMLRDIAAASPHGLSLGILRYFNVSGADPLGRSGQNSRHPHHLIEIATQVITGQRPNITVFGNDYPTPDGTGVRDYVHVSDVASAHVQMLRACLAAPGQSHLFNLGYGRGQSVLDVLAAIARAEGGRPVPYQFGPRRGGDPASLVADATAAQLLDWQPEHDDIERIVRHALAWERRRLQLVAAGN
jgi:UDP-glucose 4-epimerase